LKVDEVIQNEVRVYWTVKINDLHVTGTNPITLSSSYQTKFKTEESAIGIAKKTNGKVFKNTEHLVETRAIEQVIWEGTNEQK
jgi:hypothetical protein